MGTHNEAPLDFSHQFALHTQGHRGLSQVDVQISSFDQVQKNAKRFDKVNKRFLTVKHLVGADIVSKYRDAHEKKLR